MHLFIYLYLSHFESSIVFCLFSFTLVFTVILMMNFSVNANIEEICCHI